MRWRHVLREHSGDWNGWKNDMSAREINTPGQQRPMQPQPETIRETYRGSGKLEGKVALITGGDSGIGRAVAVHFAREGADVAIVYLSEDKDAQDTQAMIGKEGRRCLLLRGDLRSEEFCKSVVDETVGNLGHLDVLVNNAADQVSKEKPEDISSEQLRLTFETNFYPYFYLVRHGLEHLEDGGIIINTASGTYVR